MSSRFGRGRFGISLIFASPLASLPLLALLVSKGIVRVIYCQSDVETTEVNTDYLITHRSKSVT